MLSVDEIRIILQASVALSKSDGDTIKKSTVAETYHVGKLSGNRLNSGTIRSQLIVCQDEKTWSDSDDGAKKSIHSDQRVFVQVGDDLWDIYRGKDLSENGVPELWKHNVRGLAQFLSNKQNLEFCTTPAASIDSDLFDGMLIKSDAEHILGHHDILSAIRTKPFVLLAGISGTGKSRMVRQLARGFCPKGSPLVDEQKPGNFEIIPVKPNWHDSTELMGFVTRITEDNKPKYVLTPFVKFLAKAWMNPNVPFFLCLDEMNLAPVEQYFAEYLSAIESRKWVDASDPTKGFKTDVVVKFGAEKSNGTVDPFVEETVKRLLPDYETAADGTPVKMLGDAMCEAGGIRIPPNLVVMGTVNMDETTCSFSRKVLDRAMTFELNDVSNMYTIDEINTEGDVPFGSIDAELARCSLLGAKDAVNSDAGKVEVDSATHDTVAKRILDYIKTVNEKLENTPFKIAYRSRDEIMVYCLERIKGGIVKLPTALDEATSMKILSRIEGDDQKLTIQVDDGHGGKKAANLLDELEKTIKGALKVANGGSDPNPECSVCSGKLEFMKGRLEAAFTNFFV